MTLNLDTFTEIMVTDRDNRPVKGIVFPDPKTRSQAIHILKALINYDPLYKIDFI
jgi:hypothetical protein